MGAPLTVHLRGIPRAKTSFLVRKSCPKGFSHLHTAGHDTVYVETRTKAHADAMAGRIQGMACMSCYTPVSVHHGETEQESFRICCVGDPVWVQRELTASSSFGIEARRRLYMWFAVRDPGF